MKKKFKFRYIFAILITISGLFQIIHWYMVKDIAVDVQATVTDISSYRQTHRHGPSTTEYRIHIKYEYDGKENTTFLEDNEYEEFDSKKLKKGNKITIKVNPNNPFEVFNDSFNTVIMGIGTLVLGVALLFTFIKLGRYEKRPIEEREAIAEMVRNRQLPRE